MCKSDTSVPHMNAEIKASLNDLTDDNIAVLVMFNPSCQERLKIISVYILFYLTQAHVCET